MTQNGSGGCISTFPHVQVPLAFIYDSRLTAEEKIVLLAIHSRCIEHEFTVVSALHLAEDLGYSIRSVKRTLKSLTEKKWITVVRRGDGKTSRKGMNQFAEHYAPAVFRYPFFYLRHTRTETEVKTLRSEVPFADESGRFTAWLNSRTLEAEGDFAPEVTGKSVGEGGSEVPNLAPLIQIRSAIFGTQSRSRVRGEEQEKEEVASLPPPTSSGPYLEETRGGTVSDPKQGPLFPLTTVDVCGMEDSMESSDSDRPVSSPKERLSNLSDVVQQAKDRARVANEKRLKKALDRDKRLANLAGSDVPVQQKKSIAALTQAWAEEMRSKYPDLAFGAWGPKERGICKNLLEKYPCQVTLTAVRYVIRRWDDIEARYFKRTGGFPSLGFLVKFHDTIFLEAQRWEGLSQIQEEWDRWFRENPDKRPPSDLVARYQKAKAAATG